MKKRVITSLVAILMIVVTLSGCATSVAFNVLKPSEFDMSEFTTLAVYDVKPYEFSLYNIAGGLILNILLGQDVSVPSGYKPFMEKTLAEYMTKRIINTLQNTDYFTIASQAQVKVFQAAASSGLGLNSMLAENLGVDATIVSSIDKMTFDEYVQERETTIFDDQLGNLTRVDTYLVQEVTMDFSYSVVDVRGGKVVGTKYFSDSRYVETLIEDANIFKAPELSNMFTWIIDDFVSKMRYQLAPYIQREYRSMMKDAMKDPRMETADRLVKDANYKQAIDLYYDIWYDTENVAAGYNAAILFEVHGQIDKAISLMKEVARKTGNPKAIQEVARLERVKVEYAKAASQIK